MKLIMAAACIAGVVFISGCTLCSTKKVPCRGFADAYFSKWFPYDQDDILLYKNLATADTFSYAISKVYMTEPYEATQGGFENNTHSCNSSKAIRSINNGSSNGYLSIDYNIREEFDDGPVTKSMSLSFKNSQWSTGEINETVMSTIPGSSLSISMGTNALFDNGVIYPLLATLISDTSIAKTAGVYKLFIAKNTGIIGFETFPEREKWIIQ